MKKIICGILMLCIGIISYAENKTFIREYTYRASDTDSKVSARTQALTEVKKLLLEELGVYVESYVNYTIESQEGHITKDFLTNEIKQMSVGITETRIIEEIWNGEQYYVKAEITADPTDVLRKINQTLEKRQADVVIDSLHLLLTNVTKNVEVKNEEINNLTQQLQTQTAAYQAQEATVNDLNKQLSSLKTQLQQYRQEEQQVRSELDRIKKNLENMTQKTVDNARAGMTPEQVKQLCGNPNSEKKLGDNLWYNYGYVWLGFTNNILVVSVPIEKYSSPSCGFYLREYSIRR